jgi:hypothetical protein
MMYSYSRARFLMCKRLFSKFIFESLVKMNTGYYVNIFKMSSSFHVNLIRNILIFTAHFVVDAFAENANLFWSKHRALPYLYKHYLYLNSKLNNFTSILQSLIIHYFKWKGLTVVVQKPSCWKEKSSENSREFPRRKPLHAIRG